MVIVSVTMVIIGMALTAVAAFLWDYRAGMAMVGSVLTYIGWTMEWDRGKSEIADSGN